MRMLLVLFDKQGQILLCRNESVYFVPTVAENLKSLYKCREKVLIKVSRGMGDL